MPSPDLFKSRNIHTAYPFPIFHVSDLIAQHAVQVDVAIAVIPGHGKGPDSFGAIDRVVDPSPSLARVSLKGPYSFGDGMGLHIGDIQVFISQRRQIHFTSVLTAPCIVRVAVRNRYCRHYLFQIGINHIPTPTVSFRQVNKFSIGSHGLTIGITIDGNRPIDFFRWEVNADELIPHVGAQIKFSSLWVGTYAFIRSGPGNFKFPEQSMVVVYIINITDAVVFGDIKESLNLGLAIY